MDTAEPRHLGWGLGGKDFPFADLHFTLHGAVQDLTGIWVLGSAFCSCEWETCSEFMGTLKLFLEFGGRRGGAYCFSFFFQTTQNAVVWPQVCLFCWQVLRQYCAAPAAVRVHCKATGVWVKVVSPMLGVVIVEGKSQLSGKGCVLRGFLRLWAVVFVTEAIPFAVLL